MIKKKGITENEQTKRTNVEHKKRKWKIIAKKMHENEKGKIQKNQIKPVRHNESCETASFLQWLL